MAKPQYSKPTSQLDLEERAKDGYEPPAKLTQGTDPQSSETPFVGVDPIYQNYANDTEKPLRAEKGAGKKFEDQAYADEVDADFGAAEAGESPEPDEDEKEEKQGGGLRGGSRASAPPSSGSSTTPPSRSSTTPPKSS